MITTADQVAAYKGRVMEAIESIKASEVGGLLAALRRVRAHGAAVYVVGNGGSYANAQHLVLHLRDVGIRAYDLMADNAWLTAESNDRAYGQAASKLLALLVRTGDIALVISGSGCSGNIISVAGAASPNVLALLGNSGGEALRYCSEAVVLPQTEYGPVEDAHSVVIHLLHESLK